METKSSAEDLHTPEKNEKVGDADGDSKGQTINGKEVGTDSIIIESSPTSSDNKQTETTSNS